MGTALTAAFGFARKFALRILQQCLVSKGGLNSVESLSNQEGNSMEAIGLLVTPDARTGKEADGEAFLKSAQPLALNENRTLKLYAIKLGPAKFGIFDTFANESG